MENNNLQTLNIEIQDHTGDRKLTLNWKPGDEVAELHFQKMFEDLQKTGYRFYSVKRVLGVFKKKDREVKYYDSKFGELIYEKPEKPLPQESTGNMDAADDNEMEQLMEKRRELVSAKEELEKVIEIAKQENEKMKGSLKMYESEKKANVKYEDQKKFSPEKESVDTSRDYVATKKMRAG